jgi:predicted AAA+ superfamily ATPase
MSFIEFLAATGEKLLIREILNQDPQKEISTVIHKKALSVLGEYLALGGMPEVVKCWQEWKDGLQCSKIHHGLLTTYRQDFGKYATKFQIKYIELLFNNTPLQLGKKFKYSIIEGEFRKRELAPALQLLSTAGITTHIFYSRGQGVPLGAFMDPQDYKIIFLDVGLSQAILGLDLAGWFIGPLNEFGNKGQLVEAFVGQEFLVYQDPTHHKDLYYWYNKESSNPAEIDYLIQTNNQIIPVEVKSGDGRTLKSIRMFIAKHTSPYGIRFSTNNYSIYDGIHSYPLYAIATALGANQELRSSIEYLIHE